MDRPSSITASVLYAGNPTTVLWSIVADATTYQLDRRTNVDADFIPIYGGLSTFYNDIIPTSAASVEYRVQAAIDRDYTWNEFEAFERDWDTLDALDWIWFLEYSEFTVSGILSLIRIVINAETLHAGYIAQINWTDISDSSGYILERKTSSDTTFQEIYRGSENTFSDSIPEAARTIEYRLMWYVDHNITWDEFDAKDHTWDTLDALDWMWSLYESAWNYAGPFEVIPNRPPTISGQDSDLGIRYRGFDVVFSVTDPDPANTVSIVVNLNGTMLFSISNAQQGVNYTAAITDERIFAMQDQSRHSIIITATDNKGASSVRTFTFTAVEDLVSTAVFYVLRDGVPAARLGNIREWTDYLEVGTHRYVIRGIDRYDNFSDSNEVIITIFVRCATLALVSVPDNYINLIIRRNERPQINQNFSVQYTETRYEGRRYPVFTSTSQRGNAMPLAFSTWALQEQTALFEFLDKGEPLVYRDLYNSRVIGVIPGLDKGFQGRFLRQSFDAFIDFNVTINQCDYNEVVAYD